MTNFRSEFSNARRAIQVLSMRFCLSNNEAGIFRRISKGLYLSKDEQHVLSVEYVEWKITYPLSNDSRVGPLNDCAGNPITRRVHKASQTN